MPMIPDGSGGGVVPQVDSIPTETAMTSLTLREKPIVVGIYGIQGCGKTTLINRLKQELGESQFAFFDGSHIIASTVKGGLDVFKNMDEAQQAHHRGLAIQAIAQQCHDTGRVGVVAGHLTLWDGGEAKAVFTRGDLDTYTHILYLDVPVETIAQYRLGDTSRKRTQMDAGVLHSWQVTDNMQTKDICRQHGILFWTVPESALKEKVTNVLDFLKDIRNHTEGENMRRSLARLDEIITPAAKDLDRVLVFDADRTLSSVDAAAIFWEEWFQTRTDSCDQLKQLFSHPMWLYSYKAFRQATLLYEVIPEPDFNRLCAKVARRVEVHPEFVHLLKKVHEKQHVLALVVTSGIRRIWEGVLRHINLHNDVKVIGGGRIADGFVVTPDVKAAIVTRLREQYGVQVFAFGDSEVDIPMLKAADEAFIVSGELNTRSKSMDRVLPAAIQDGLRARQLLLPACAPPRLDETRLPVVRLDDVSIDTPLGRAVKQPSRSRFMHATGTAAAKLLMTPMRDANVAGVALREAHRRAGWWLATHLISEVIGLEEIAIGHVQGHSTTGYQLLGEKTTTIVALMRGGEPMAFGVSEAFPSATFVHAAMPKDVKGQHLIGRSNLILVDSVVNSGASVLEFISYIRSIDKSLRIVVVAGVVQAGFLNQPPEAVANDINVGVVALRVSENKFKGRGGTDTGNRLFNTTHLD
ncbi:Shikimate kinase [Cytospora mali]|uniref:Shikimate kinase n=1 Tax=Cytospora mali TaxID=578113 RepID=A0A194VHR1_CYTMA|nr:Shikimate kinase [Valsa mali]